MDNSLSPQTMCVALIILADDKVALTPAKMGFHLITTIKKRIQIQINQTTPGWWCDGPIKKIK